jgi:glycosyltransferase involved in cell wall biosynthesis
MAHTDAVETYVEPLTTAVVLDPELVPILSAGEHSVVKITRARHVVVVIPAYNEERFIGSVVLKTLRHAATVVVVDDGSRDATAEIAEAAGAIVVRHPQNRGKGVALNTGFRKAREFKPDVVVTIDADGQHVPGEMAAVMRPVLDGKADVVIGSRYLEPTSDVPQHRVWGHRAFNALSTGVSGVAVSDSQSGFRAFSPKALRVLSFNSTSFSVESEMQLLAREHRLTVSEVPITVYYQDKPKRPVLSHGMNVLGGILQLTGQYRPLLFFGVPGLILLIIGIGWGIWVIDIYRSHQTLPLGYTVLSSLLTTLASLCLFTGIILHSVRGLLISFNHRHD